MKPDPFSGAVYVFRVKRADRVKLIHWDGTGVCLFGKRLEYGTFRWPSVQDGVMRLLAAELSALLEGLDWKRVHDLYTFECQRCGRLDVRGVLVSAAGADDDVQERLVISLPPMLSE